MFNSAFKTNPYLKRAVMTANAFFDDIEMSKKAGMNEHISQPLKMQELADTICGLCKKYKTE